MKPIELAATTLLVGLLLPLPGESVPLVIGHRTVTYVDPARDNREVLTEVYYPSEVAGDDVPVAPGSYPVITFGHGTFMAWTSYEYFWTAVVPRGYIVAFPRTEGGIFPSHEEFGRDLAFLIDELRSQGTLPGSPFCNHVAPTSCVMGHSMGGGASVLAASYNPGITALSNLAAAQTSPSAIAAAALVIAPALMLAGSEDCVTPPPHHQIPIYGALGSRCKTLVTLIGGSHCQFADHGSSCENFEPCTPGIPEEDQHALVESLLAPWLDWTLKGSSEGFAAFQDLLAAGEGITYEQDCPTTSSPVNWSPTFPFAIGPYPNPSAGGARIVLDLATMKEIRVEVMDTAGRLVRVLTAMPARAGSHAIEWDGKDGAGRDLSAGVYYCRVRWSSGQWVGAVVLLR